MMRYVGLPVVWYAVCVIETSKEHSVSEDQQEPGAAAPEPSYTIKISGDGISVEKTVAKEMAADIIQFLMTGGASRAMVQTRVVAPVAVVQGSAAVAGVGSPPLSLAEYLEEINARSIPERILGMAAWLTEVTGQLTSKTVTKGDIKPCFKLVGDPLPANFARDWSLVVTAGWLAADHGNADAFFVTRRGLAAIAERFANEGDRIKRIRKRQNEGRGGGGSAGAGGSDTEEGLPAPSNGT